MKCELCFPIDRDDHGPIQKYNITDKDDVGIDMWLCEEHADVFVEDGCEVEIITNCGH